MGFSRHLLIGVVGCWRPPRACLSVVTLATQLAATQLGVSLKKLAPDLHRAEPVRGCGSAQQNLPALVRAAVMLPLVRAGGLRHRARQPVRLHGASLSECRIGLFASLRLSRDAAMESRRVFLVFGAVDLFRQRRRYRKDLRMSKQEIRDEFKETEGNPQMKARIRRIQRDRLRHKMMKEVPKATAVIVNPTHYAVALRYALDSMATPVVVAKGRELSGAAHSQARHGVPTSHRRESASGASPLPLGGRRPGDPRAPVSRGSRNPGLCL